MKARGSQDSSPRIWAIFKKLSRLQKMKVIAKLERETCEERWNSLTERLTCRFRKKPISDEEITEAVNEVRQERYDRLKNRS